MEDVVGGGARNGGDGEGAARVNTMDTLAVPFGGEAVRGSAWVGSAWQRWQGEVISSEERGRSFQAAWTSSRVRPPGPPELTTNGEGLLRRRPAGRHRSIDRAVDFAARSPPHQMFIDVGSLTH